MGTSLLQEHAPGKLLNLARAAEAAGVDSLWVPEAPFYWDAFAILGSLAQGTERVRLGPGVTSPYLRPPHLLAMSAATLDRLSGGRAFIGLGRSLPQWYQRLLGMDTGDPVKVMEETVSLLRQWWQHPHEASSRGHFQVRGLPRYTHGVQRHLPVYLAAVGPRMLGLAALLADGLVLHWPTLDFVRRTLREVRAQAASAGRSLDGFAVIISTGVEVTRDPEPALERMKREMALFLSVPGMDVSLTDTEHDVRSIVAQVRGAMRAKEIVLNGGWTREFERLGDIDAAARAIPSGLADQVALVGDADSVRRRLAQYQGAGVTHCFVPASAGESPEACMAYLNAIDPDLQDDASPKGVARADGPPGTRQ